MIRLHLCGFILGFLLDLIIGDPHWFLIHPVRIMGKLISALDRAFLGPQTEGRHKSFESGKIDLSEYVQGIFTILLTVLLSVLSTAVLLLHMSAGEQIPVCRSRGLSHLYLPVNSISYKRDNSCEKSYRLR